MAILCFTPFFAFYLQNFMGMQATRRAFFLRLAFRLLSALSCAALASSSFFQQNGLKNERCHTTPDAQNIACER